MKKIEKVITYNKRPRDFEFDGKRVYLNKNIKEDTQNDVTLYMYEVEIYEKDEFLNYLQGEQVSLEDKTKNVEDMLMELSSQVYS